jgi:hypothetical protein
MNMDSWWEGAAKLLSAGPLGLGAIIVLVTGTILIAGKAVEQGRLKLSLAMLVSGCILVLAGLGVLVLQTNASEAAAKVELEKAANRHQLFFRVEPLNSKSKLPAPDIIINTKKIDQQSPYTVGSDITIIVDVTEALQQLGPQQSNISPSGDNIESNKKVRDRIASDIDTSIAQIQRIVQLMTQSCPGGAHGTDPFHFNDLVVLTTSITNSLQKTSVILLEGN